MLSKAQIEERALGADFKVMDYGAGRGRSVIADLRDERTGRTIRIELWPDSTDADLTFLLTRAAFETRATAGAYLGTSQDWLM